MSDEDMSYNSWAGTLRPALAELAEGDRVIAHSFGASILLRMLTEEPWPQITMHLLAMPNWGPDGWAVPDYAFTGPEPPQALTLHHCVDDAVVPHSHLALNAALLPNARVVSYLHGGHQFDGQSEEVAASFHTA
ncbi:alpha/beta fold hydrolase [Dietzia sp.]|uniref:alpha/beta fold hydrolase n=1 Tax=Dietzia sp. TaxID=1871616 RepID=UPI002FD99C12